MNTTFFTQKVVDLVQQCPQVCTKLYGDGNPDISGIGVMISFAIQGVLYLIFGSLLSFLFALISPQANLGTRLVMWRFQVLFNKIQGTGNMICFATLVSGYVTLRRGPSVFELIMIKKLIAYESILLYQAMFASVVDGTLSRSERKHETLLQWAWNGFVLGALGVSTAAFNMYLDFTRNPLSRPTGDVPGLILKYCSTHGDFPVVSQFSTIAQAVWAAFDLSAQALGLTLLFIIPLLSARVRRAFNGRIRGLFFAFYLPIRFAFYLVVTMRDVAKVRSRMHEKIGPSDIDNQWGFGQVGAVVVWAPVAVQIIVTLASLYPFSEWWRSHNDAMCKCEWSLRLSYERQLMSNPVIAWKRVQEEDDDEDRTTSEPGCED